MFSELAAGSSSSGRILGSTALRVGWLTAKNACCTAKRPSSSQTFAAARAPPAAQNSPLVTIRPDGRARSGACAGP